MDNILGYSSFVLIVPDIDHDKFLAIAERFKSMSDIVKEYRIGKDKDIYWVIQLDVMYDQRKPEELCHFVYTYFPFVAMKQEKSTYILVPDRTAFVKLLNKAYGKERKIYFFYDMLSIGDRYLACFGAGLDADPYEEIRLLHWEGAGMYSLVFGNDCSYLFVEDSEIELLNETTGEKFELDLSEGLYLFKFHVAVLR